MIVHCVTTLRHRRRQAKFRERWLERVDEIRFVYAPDYRDLAMQKHGRVFALTCGLVGHLTVWEELIDQSGWHLIAEDDAIPLSNFEESYRLVLETPNDFQIVKLHHAVHHYTGNDRLFAPRPEDWTSTVAYLMRDARRLLSAVRFLGAADRMIAQIASVGIVYPIAVGEDVIPSTMPRDFQFQIDHSKGEQT